MNLLLAAVLLMQDKTAEETFKKIEEAISKAKTISAKFSIEVSDPISGKKKQASGTMLLATGNRANVIAPNPAKIDSGESMSIVSDGKRQRVRVMGPDAEERETPPAFRVYWDSLIVRQGIPQCMASIGLIKEPMRADILKRAFELSDFALGKDENGVSAVSFTVSPPNGVRGTPFRTRLSYNSEDFSLVKRVMTPIEKVATKAPIVEVFEEFVFNAAIPDEKFKLPEEKK